MKLTAFRLGILVVLLIFIAVQAVSPVSATTSVSSIGASGNDAHASAANGLPAGNPASPLLTPSSGAFVDPPWVAKLIGRKPWQWSCSVNSPFNLPLSDFASYAS